MDKVVEAQIDQNSTEITFVSDELSEANQDNHVNLLKRRSVWSHGHFRRC